MREFTPADFEEGPEHQGEKWYLEEILEALKEGDVKRIIATLYHAWRSGYEDITQVPVNISETEYSPDQKTEVDSLENILTEYFEDKINTGSFDAETRKEIYKKLLPYDVDLAYVLIKKNNDFDEYRDEESYGVATEDQQYSTGTSFGVLNPEELYATQVSYYQYIIDNYLGHVQLYEALKNDGHLNGNSPYKLSKILKRKIVEYAKGYIDTNQHDQRSSDFVKAVELRDIFTEKENS